MRCCVLTERSLRKAGSSRKIMLFESKIDTLTQRLQALEIDHAVSYRNRPTAERCEQAVCLSKRQPID